MACQSIFKILRAKHPNVGGILTILDVFPGKKAAVKGITYDPNHRSDENFDNASIQNSIDNTESPYSGGAHRETSQPTGDGLDSHHCPAKNCYQDAPISSIDGPAVQMDPADHRRTSSYGSGAEAQACRTEQQRLLNEGRLQDAIQMDVDDIRRIEVEIGQPGKYDTAIQQLQNYANTLEPNDFITP
jgi:hypothetical protein